MHVLMISPGYPSEMPWFTRGLAAVGAAVFGLGDQPFHALGEHVQGCLRGYTQVRSLWDEQLVLEHVRRIPGIERIERVECLWEPCMMLAARLRAMLGLPGAGVEQTRRFRDKELMKQALDQAGLRTPRHVRCDSTAQCLEAAEHLGYPLIIKPIAGAGSADTYRADDESQLDKILPRLTHVPQVSVEEFIDGEEYTFDSITVDGQVAYYNVAWYRPRPLVARSNEWISPQVIALRDVDAEHLRAGVTMGHQVIQALGVDTAFTHMEWYRKANGEVVFGEIGLRPPGAHQVDQMNYACDIDVFVQWARVVTGQGFAAEVERRYNVATVYKRAQGRGQISRIEGLERINREYRDHVVWNALLPIGSQRRNWLQTLLSDGFVILRHPDLATTMAMADDISTNVRMYASE